MYGTLNLQAVSKRIGPRQVLADVDLELAAGECHVLLGSSGCGKSTILKIILGLITPDSGRVHIGAGEVGYVPQEDRLFPHLTIGDNITMVARLGHWSAERIDARLAELQHVVQFEPALLRRYPRQLSGGQRQRAALLRAVFLDPALLLLDEPLGALDPIIRASVQDELKHVFQTLKKTVLIVTHDLDEARFFGDRITLMDRGRVVQRGTYDDLRSSPRDAFVTQFIRSQRRWEGE